MLSCLAEVESKIESGFDFQDNNPLIWLRYILKNDQRTQPTLFSHSPITGKVKPIVDEKVKERIKQRRDTQKRIDYLHELSGKVHRNFRSQRKKHMDEFVPEIDEAARNAWIKELRKSVSPALVQFINKDVWTHPMFTKQTDQFLIDHNQPTLDAHTFFNSIGFDPTENENEIKRLENLLKDQ